MNNSESEVLNNSKMEISNSSLKKDLSISLASANLYAIPLIIIPFIIFGIPYVLLWGWENIEKGFYDFTSFFFFLLVFLTGIFIHELIHGYCWVYFGKKGWDKIKFGFSMKNLTPYAHCKEPVSAGAYKKGTAAPGILMGIIPALFAIATGNSWVLWFGIIFSVAAGGDFIVLWLIRKVKKDTLVEDHPSRAGCYVYEK